MYKDSPKLAEREGKDAYIQALPSTLCLPVAAANPLTVRDCLEVIERLSCMTDLPDDPATIKKVRRVNQDSSDRKNGKSNSNSGGGKKGQSTLLCWDCGQMGHAHTACPEHFRFKPKMPGDSSSQPATSSISSVAEDSSASPPARQEENQMRSQ